MNFGEFIREKRLSLSIEAKTVAQFLGVSAPYMVDIEKGRRNPPDENSLKKLSKILQLTKDDTYLMFDLAGKARGNVSSDISKYVIKENMARVALRTAKDKKLGDDFWTRVNDMARKEGECKGNE